ncbi:MFS transporter [Carnobacteriaceae bacterium zg-ZUI78]|uniref:MFS transporter n=1 Tax=Granulicatella sp. zg-84 TaxID=2678503 RepID=UPI0013C0FAF0|nr:MFS transporter [Granulicatella sp. zg-84]MBS4749782.1 MFS transporter [Carnobacteriaceae bacterium zg-ZUI78]NEW65661.1 MFS transporter [Granulicatella sp. zg-84]QMI85698.1 MFS transporter [Carnobacteriaceae bacterium zg-84]
MKRILQNKLFMTSFTADLLSNFGDTLFYLALMNYVLVLPDATLAISAISISELLPTLAEVFTGYWADKTKYKLNTILATLFFRVMIYSIVGILMGFQPALWIVIIVAILNFFSDISGQYESGLFTPISIYIISDEDREQAMSFRQAISQVSRIGFLSLGGLFITWFSYQHIAFINAGTFLVSALIMLSIYKPLNKLVPKEVSHSTKDKSHFFNNLKTAYENVKSLPIVFKTCIIAIFLNAVFSSVNTLMLRYIHDLPNFFIINSQTTLVIMSTSITISGIIGSVLGMTLLKNTSLTTLLKCATISPVIVYLGFGLGNIYIVVFGLMLVGLLSSALNPKFSAIILNSLPKDSLATTLGGLGTALQSGYLVLGVTVSTLITFIPPYIIVWTLLGFSLLLVLYILLYAKFDTIEEK